MHASAPPDLTDAARLAVRGGLLVMGSPHDVLGVLVATVHAMTGDEGLAVRAGVATFQRWADVGLVVRQIEREDTPDAPPAGD